MSCAAEDQTVPGSLQACAAIKADSERYACYDREMAKLVPGAVVATAGAAAVAPAAAPVLTPEQRFGLSPAQADAKVSEVSAPGSLESLEAKVSGIRNITNGRVLIDLDNGQVWRQVDTDVTVRLKPGDAVSIKRGTLGSYWLSSNGRAWRVKRVK
jgi:hypothetical protein